MERDLVAKGRYKNTKKDGKWNYVNDTSGTSFVHYRNGLAEGQAASFDARNVVRTRSWFFSGDRILYSSYDRAGRMVANEFSTKGLLVRSESFDYKKMIRKVYDQNDTVGYKVLPFERLNGDHRYGYPKGTISVKYKNNSVIGLKYVPR